ncbi:MAG: trypsin-like serine peptidase [Paracoccaceae bacterium]
MRFFLALFLQIFWVSGSLADTSDLTSLETLDQGRGWMAVGRLSYQNGQGFCTATLIAPDLVLTASHCLYDLDSGELLTLNNLEFQAGWRNGRAEAYSIIGGAVTFPDFQPTETPKIESVRNDVALLKLLHPIKKHSVQPFAIAALPNDQKSVAVVSYALGRINAPSIQSSCDISDQTEDILSLNCDVDFGASGAPVFYFSEQGPMIVSIVSAVVQTAQEKLVFGPLLERSLNRLQNILANQDGL